MPMRRHETNGTQLNDTNAFQALYGTFAEGHFLTHCDRLRKTVPRRSVRMQSIRLDRSPTAALRPRTVYSAAKTPRPIFDPKRRRSLWKSRTQFERRLTSQFLNPPFRVWASPDEPQFIPDDDNDEEKEEGYEADADLESFFEEEDSEEMPETPIKSQREEASSSKKEEEVAEEEKASDVTAHDKLAYERLIIEGADVENAEEEMKDMEETLAAVQERYLTGSAYETAPEPSQMEIKKDFPYPPMPKFSAKLDELLELTQMKKHAKLIRQSAQCISILSHAENVKPGDVYFAKVVPGYDGIEKIPLAFDNGAVAIFLKFGDEEAAVPSSPSSASWSNSIDPTLDGNNTNRLVPQNSEFVSGDWMQALKERGVETEEMTELIPVVPVRHLFECMADLSCIFYGHPSSKMRIIGIAGSHGKGTTAWILRRIFAEHKDCIGMISDMGYTIMEDALTEEGDLFIPTENDPAHKRTAATPYHLTPFKGRSYIKHTIPDPLQMQKVLTGMVYRGVTVCVIDCPIYAIYNGSLDNVYFETLVYANLESEAIQTAEDFRSVKTTCSCLFQGLQTPEQQRSVVNIDDPHVQDFLNASSEVPVVTYSLYNTEADVYTETVTYSIWESEMVICTPVGKIQLITPLIGKHQVYNILASVAVSLVHNLDLTTIVAGIEALDFVPGRYEVVDEGQDFSVVVDRADTPTRLSSLIHTLKACGARRLFLVFGCSSYHTTEEREQMGNAAFYHADIVIITSDSPGFEPPNQVIDDIVGGFPDEVLQRSALWVTSPWQDPGRVPWWFEEWLFRAQKEVRRYIVEDRSLAIRGAIGTARKDDVIVIAGRGDRDYSWWVDKDDKPFQTWFEDRLEVRDALIKLPYLYRSYVRTDHLPWLEPEEMSNARMRLV